MNLPTTGVSSPLRRVRLAPSLTAPNPLPAGIAVVVQYVETHCAQPLVLAELAALLAVSPRQLERLFQRACQMNLRDYLKHYRLQRAADLLQTTTLRIKEIAAQVGYRDETRLMREFKLNYGQTPSQFRQQKQRKTVGMS